MTKIAEAYIRMDRWIIGKINTAYLWLWDWTGTYLATVMFLLLAAQATLTQIPRGNTVTAAVLIIICGLSLSFMYYCQAKSMFEAINRTAMMFEASKLRHAFIWFLAFGAVSDIFFSAYAVTTTIGNVSLIVYWYAICVKLRKRDPKEFKITSLIPAPQGSSS